MASYHEIRLSGSGGQGLMLAGSFLAEAAGIYDDKFIVQTRSYGPEARGGTCRSELIISSDPIIYPEVRQPHLVLAMTQEASDKYHKDIIRGGILIIDSDLVKKKPLGSFNIIEIPLIRIAKNIAGREIAANAVALGAISSIVDWISKNAIKKVILLRSPDMSSKINEQAFEAGYEAAERLKFNREVIRND